ncbi:hypothetical protein ANAEL_02802 [Anaerolineales bacterium]|nr:hypothetical protein ANAEL_02802 [Anaerolineales bacterium]
MPKTFYMERDIEDLLKKGVKSLIVDDDVVLTDLAYEKARKLGLELLRAEDQPPAAPVRPYIAKPVADSSKAASPVGTVATASAPSGDDLHQRVYKASLARLGDSVDPKLLDVIVRRVLGSISTK